MIMILNLALFFSVKDWEFILLQLMSKVVWESLDTANGVYVPYSVSVTNQLEAAFVQAQQDSANAFGPVLVDCGGQKLSINLQDMVETAIEGNTRRRILRRLPFMSHPRLVCQIDIVLVETERYFPLIGWGKRRLPTDRPQWADKSGKHHATLEDADAIIAANHFIWSDVTPKWVVYKAAHETDEDGWSYSVDFPMEFHDRKHSTDFVRRRFWMRSAVTAGPVKPDAVHLSADLSSLTSTRRFLMLPADVAELHHREHDLEAALLLLDTSECQSREEVQRFWLEITERVVGDTIRDWARVDRMDLVAAATRLALETDCKRTQLLDQWSSLKGPRQAALDLSISSVKNLIIPNRIVPNAYCLRLSVRILSNNVTLHSEPVSVSANPVFNFKTFIVLENDSHPILITIEAVGHGFVDLIAEPEGLAMIPLSLRSNFASLQRTVSDANVYQEKADVSLSCLDPTGEVETTTSVRVSWVLVPRESDFIEFCDDCGLMAKRCSCAPDVVEARSNRRCREEAKRQAEIYAARTARVAKAKAEEEKRLRKEAERKLAELQELIEVLSQSESDDRAHKSREEDVERTALETRQREARLRIEAAARKKDRLRLFFKIRIDELMDQRLACALEVYSGWRQVVVQAKEARTRRAEQDRVAALLCSLQQDEQVHRQQWQIREATERNHIVTSETSGREAIAGTAADQERMLSSSAALVDVVRVTQDDKDIVQQVKKDDKSKAGCCSVM